MNLFLECINRYVCVCTEKLWLGSYQLCEYDLAVRACHCIPEILLKIRPSHSYHPLLICVCVCVYVSECSRVCLHVYTCTHKNGVFTVCSVS